MSTGWPSITLRNIGGMQKFFYVPYGDVASIPFYFSKYLESPVVLVGGAQWIEGYSTFNKLQFKEEQSNSDAGPFFNVLLQGFVPWVNDSLQDLFDNMARDKYIIDCYNNNNIRLLLGTKENPLQFTAAFDSGATPGTVKGYAFKFFTESADRAPQYAP